MQPGAKGTRLSNLRERLALLPHLAASMAIHKEGDWTLAELRLSTTLAP